MTMLNPGVGSSGGGSGGNVNLNQVGGASYALGSTNATNSMPVVLSNDYISTALVKLTDGTNIANVKALISANALDVAIVDGSGNQITSFGGGTQYSQGTVNSNPTGTVAMGLNPSNQINAFGLDSSGNLKVSGLSGGTIGDVSTIAGVPIQTSTDGTQVFTQADEFGDPLRTTAGALNGFITNPVSSPVNVSNVNNDQTILGFLGNSGINSTLTLNLAYPAVSAVIIVILNQALNAFMGVQYSYDGVTFNPSSTMPVRSIGSIGNSATNTINTFTTGTTYQALMSLAGVKAIRLNLSSGYTSGSALFKIIASQTPLTAYDSSNIALGSNGNTATNSYAPLIANAPYSFNGATLDSIRSVINATNSTGTGIQAVGLLAQVDDVSPTSISENQFGNLRMSARRALTMRGEDQNSATYSATTDIVPAASATDIFTITGNASTTVVITKIRLSGTQTTGGLVTATGIKRSAADTGGTSTSVTAVPHDSNDAAASATLLNYSANPSGLGAAVGNVRSDSIPLSTTSATTNNIVEWLFGERGRGITLRGTAQQFAINLGGVTITGGSINVDIEWYEF